MTINQIHLKNYRQFADKVITLQNGINIIYGLNEKGKSTIVSGILSGLYFDPSSNSKALFEYINSWNSEEKPFVEIDFTHGNTEYNLKKDFQSKKSQLTSKLSTLTDSKLINSKLCDFLGINNLDIFKAVALIKGNEVSNIVDNAKLASQLTQISTGSDVNALKALERIQDAADEISKGMTRTVKQPGFLKINKDLLFSKKEELNKKLEVENVYIKNLQIFHNSESEIKTLENSLAEKIQLSQNNSILRDAKEKINAINIEIKSLNDQIIEIDKFNLQLKEIDRDRKLIANSFEELESIESKLVAFVKDGTETQATLESKREEFANISVANESTGDNKKLIYLICVSVLIFSIIAFVKSWLNPAIAIGIGIISLLCLAYFAYQNKQSSSSSHLSKLQKNARTKYLEDIVKDLEAKDTKIKKDLEKLLEENKFKSVEDFNSKKQNFAMLDNKEKNIKEFISDKLKTSGFETLENLLENLNSNLREKILQKDEIKVGKLEKLINFEVSAEEFVKLEKEIANINSNLAQLREVNLSSKVRIQDLVNDQDGIAQLEEEISEIERLILFWENRLYSLNIASEMLSIAIRNTATTAGSKIEKEMKKYLLTITNGRYSQVQVLDDFRIEIYSEEKKEYISPYPALSSGTIDQIYFIAKIIYLSLIAEEKNPPIIMDDPFVSFDEERTANSFEILESMKSQQILFFTCHKEYLKYSKNVILLD